MVQRDEGVRERAREKEGRGKERGRKGGRERMRLWCDRVGEFM